jgi:exopolysaccharide biosynthesis polyprenyl glycosylphosphotransferase
VSSRAVPASARILRRLLRNGRFQRIAVVGSRDTAAALKHELALAGAARASVIGCITVEDEEEEFGARAHVPVLGSVAELRLVTEAHGIDLLVVSNEAPRVFVLDQAISFSQRPVRVCELTDFYEAVFGHVPTAEINACWFEYLVHPTYRVSKPGKRMLDLLIALCLILVSLPVVALLAIVIMSDGGPLLFRQVRIGEGGRPITIYKLRTMRPGSGATALWSPANDPRVTRVGRLLRHTHIDELPQLLNVLRGEMSLVGPRPEQPEFVARLERMLPFYQRRHLIKPGITGWAQIRCGYANSDQSSAWKLCHDLFYMKYRSTRLDLLIMLRTLRQTSPPPQFALEPRGEAAFVAASMMPLPELTDAPPELTDAPPELTDATNGRSRTASHN